MADTEKKPVPAKPVAFVTGWPVQHSRSPLIHGFWLREHGIEGKYEKHPCPVEDFPNFFKTFAESGYVGGNITIPHKEQALTLVDHCDETAEMIGAINTVWLEGNKIHGTNTDCFGFLANLDQQLPGWDNRERLSGTALVLGAGGASRAVIYGILRKGFSDVLIANRTRLRAEDLARHFGPSCRATGLDDVEEELGKVTILVNTTSLGMEGGEFSLPFDLKDLSPDCLVTDIVYTPVMTPLLESAAAQGLTVVDGLGMLLHQAVPGFERWFGVRPKVTEELRDLVLADMEAK